MISYNGVWLDLKDIERITAENSGLSYFGTKFAVMAVMKNNDHFLMDYAKSYSEAIEKAIDLQKQIDYLKQKELEENT
jgi:hypothetical protein